MSPWVKYGSFCVLGSMLLSGSVYFFFKYGMQSQDPFTLISHPLEPLALKLHILSGPLLIFIFGFLFCSHVREKLNPKAPVRRRGGLMTALLFVVTALSGYLLQTASDPELHEILVYVHLAGGVGFSFFFGLHSLPRRYRSTKVTRVFTENYARSGSAPNG